MIVKILEISRDYEGRVYACHWDEDSWVRANEEGRNMKAIAKRNGKIIVWDSDEIEI